MPDTINNWQKIWGNKGLGESLEGKSEFEAFCLLKEADGFDVAVGDKERYYRGFYDEFLRFYNHITSLCDDSVKSLYEVGCGSGVNLFLFGNRIEGLRSGAVDYSESLLKSASEIAGGDDFTCGEAADMPLEPKYDLIMSESVFEYFPSDEYATVVLRKMLEKSNKAVAVLGIYDKDREQDMMDYRRSRIPDYDKRYEGLPKRFYAREWFMEIAGAYGKTVSFEKPDNPEYWNAEYQYNAFIH